MPTQALTIEALQRDVICAELTPAALQNLNLLAQEVFSPLLRNPVRHSRCRAQ